MIYSSGKVLDGLQTGRLDTENFLRTGSLEGISSRADLALLEDLRDAATFILAPDDTQFDARYVCSINATITRSGPLHPGELRTAHQQIGVRTRYGRHEPPALDLAGLQLTIDAALERSDTVEAALWLFVLLAKAQAFEDGNKRTAIFAANRLLITAETNMLLTIPLDDEDPAVSDRFNDLMARAYIFDEHTAIIEYLRSYGLVGINQ
ncbi:Fic family protein [Leucobacter sp. HY1908]